MQAIGTHDAGLVPALKRQAKIARAGGEDKLLIGHHPGALFIGKANRRLWHGRHARAVLEGTPGIDAQRDLNTRLKGFFELRVRGKDLLDHAGLIIDRPCHATAKIERRIQAHQRRGNRVFIDQQHAGPALGGGNGGGHTGLACTDHNNIGLLLGRREFAGDREPVNGRACHQTASKAWERSAIRSSMCSSPTEMRMVPSSIPTSRRWASGTA